MRARKDDPPELDEPVKYLRLNTFAEDIEGTSYFYFMANKRNNTGLLYNQRFFLMIGNDKFGYAREYLPEVKLPFRSKNKIPQLKASIRIKDVVKCESADSLTVVVCFNEEAVQLDTPPYWILKLETPEMAESVLQRISEARNKQALQARGVKGMYEGPNGISEFKKKVEGDFVTPQTTSNISVEKPLVSDQQVQLPTQQISYAKSSENPQMSAQSPVKQKPLSTSLELEHPDPTASSVQHPAPPAPLAAHTYLRSYYWLEKILVNSNYMDSLDQFNRQAQKIVAGIVDRQQQESINHHQMTSSQGLTLRFAKADEGSSNQLRREFDNYKYLLARTNNERRVKIPLVALVNYKGWLGLVKLYIPGLLVQQTHAQELVQEISTFAKIEHQHFEAQLVELDSHYFQLNGLNLPKYHFLTELPRLLPVDPFLRSSVEQWVTPECMLALFEKNAVVSTEQIKSHLSNQFDTLLGRLANDEEEVYCYWELQSLLRAYHLPLAYLPLLYKQCSSPGIKQYLWTALYARELYKLCLRESSKNAISLVKQLNEQLEFKGELWQETCAQLQQHHQIINQRTHINKGQLAYFLIELFGLVVDEKLVGERLARSQASEVFNHNAVQFVCRTEDLQTYNSALWQRVDLITSLEYTETAHDDLVWVLKLNDNPQQILTWPETRLFTRLRLSLANFTAPVEVEAKATPYSEFLYRPTTSRKPSLWRWKLALTKIKWLLLENLTEQATTEYEALLSDINNWSNGKHPILYELLTMRGRYHILQKQYASGVQLLEQGRRLYNEQKPDDLTELVNISTEIASAYEKNKEIRAALRNNVNIAEDLQKMGLENDEIYAEIQCKIGRQALFLEKFELAKEAALKSAGLYYELKNTEHAHEGKIVECYELLSRVAELSDEELYSSICENCAKGLGELKEPDSVEKMLRIVLLPLLTQALTAEDKTALTRLIESIPKLTNGYNRAYGYLGALIKNGSLIDFLKSCLEDCQSFCVEVQEADLIDNWRGIEEESKDGTPHQDFVCLLQALTNFLGPHFLLGCLD